jgi:hypothetical protein
MTGIDIDKRNHKSADLKKQEGQHIIFFINNFEKIHQVT